jgi:hypothetical protein
MAWETLTSNDGIYLIDWTGLTRIVRSCKNAETMRAFSGIETTPGERDWIALGMRLPDLHTVNVDWTKVNLETTTRTEMELRSFYAGAQRSMKAQLRNLVQMMEKAEDDRDAFRDKQDEAQGKTQDNIESCIGNAEIVVDVLKEVRDGSAEVVMVGATYMSGGTTTVLFGSQLGAAGAGALLTGIGSGMKGYFAYQDTGKADRAVATFSTNLLMGAFDLKVGALTKAMSTANKIGIGILWAKSKALLDIPKSLIEGKNLKQAVSGAAVKLLASTPGGAGIEGLKAKLGEEAEAWAIPVEAALARLLDHGGDALSESGEKKETKGPPAHLPHLHRNHRLMDAVIYDESIIEQSAVKQIGSRSAA